MLRHAATRAFSSSAARASAYAEFALPKDVPTHAPAPVATVANAESGLRVGAFDHHGPFASLVLVVPAGARAESSQTLGAAQYLKNYALKYTATQTPLKIAREVELRGVTINTSVEREHLVYQVEFLRDDLQFVVSLLADVVYNTQYNPWEFKDVAALTAAQTAAAAGNVTDVAFEAAHRLAFRQGLGNSLIAPVYSNITNDTVKAFAKDHLLINNQAALYGVGVNGDELASLANAYFAQSAAAKAAAPAAKYFGGESRIDVAKGNNVTVAFNGAAANTQEAAALSVLAAYLGGAKHVKWGNAVSPLAKAGQDAHALVRAFNATYSDAGLFGLSATCKTSPHNAAKGIQAAIVALKQAAQGVAPQDLTRAVNQAKAAYLTTVDAQVAHARAAAAQLATSGQVTAAADAAASLAKVSAADVARAAERVLASKPTIVAAGKTVDLPYADTLGL
ncbi:ubiquinol-cytochrome c reductase core subunit 1 [Allomyces arbusculus]|nr:ubiquinol-cytochrome c reductase core subunit 1 [Allomyces arbusculus]